MQSCNKKLAALLAAMGALPIALAPSASAQPTTPTRPPATTRPVAPSAGGAASAPAAGTPAAPTAPSAPAASPIPADLKVAATVNKDEILMSDINAVVARILLQQPNIPQADQDAIKREICEDMIVERLLVQEAKRQNLVPDKKQIDDAVWRYQKPFLSLEAFKKHLSDSGRTEEDLRKILSDDMAVSMLSRKLTEDVTVGDDEIAKYYNENKADFVVPEMVHVRHIQVSVKSDAPDTDRAKAKKKAEDILKKATASGADFVALAKESSDDKVSAPSGGDLGFIARDDIIDKAFGDVAFTAPVGKTYPKVVETKFGYNIIKVEEKKPSRTLALSEVSTYIKPRLMQEKLKERLDARVVELRKAAVIKKNI